MQPQANEPATRETSPRPAPAPREGSLASLQISVVIPAKDEAENLPELIGEIHAAMAGRDYEIVVVDDGSRDDTPSVLAALGKSDQRLVSIRHRLSQGKGAAVHTGVQRARSRLIATLDGDGQNDPSYVPGFIERFADPGIGLVAGERLQRQDIGPKRIASRIANGLRRTILRDNTRDAACGLKAFRRGAFLDLPYFETMHRFLPALFLADGWKVAHVDVVDRPRRHGQSHYGNLDRLLIGIPDLFGVWWLIRRRRRSPFRDERTESDSR